MPVLGRNCSASTSASVAAFGPTVSKPMELAAHADAAAAANKRQ
jgi:hypothetical protein